jgi:hypothetical protein
VVQGLPALPGYGATKVTALVAASGVDEKRRAAIGPARREKLVDAVTPQCFDARPHPRPGRGPFIDRRGGFLQKDAAPAQSIAARA